MKRKGYAFLIVIAALLWSFDGLLRRSLGFIPSPTLVLIEHVIRLIILLPFVKRFIPEYKKMTKRDWVIITGIGIISGALATTLYTAALSRVEHISYSVVALLQQTQPIFAVILAVVFLKEKTSFRYITLASIALISAYFLTFPDFRPHYIGTNGELTAALLATGAALCWGTGTVLSKLILTRLSYMASIILRFAIVIPVVFIMSLINSQPFSLSSLTSGNWFNIFMIAIFSGIISFVFYYRGLQHTEVKIATFAEFAWPLSAAFIGFWFLGERLTAIQVIAGIILLADILVLSLTAKEQ